MGNWAIDLHAELLRLLGDGATVLTSGRMQYGAFAIVIEEGSAYVDGPNEMSGADLHFDASDDPLTVAQQIARAVRG